ncbi:MAG: PQQ-dependent sugar dehydrogenase [Bacteroidales bacterium]|nr:PQQ-dependent sugar dehydrogenase [Bacteroidales bacterium]
MKAYFKKFGIVIFAASFVILTVVNSAMYTNRNELYQNKNHLEEVKENYLKFCAGCHGKDLERFTGREWVFGGTPDEMFSTIKNGRPSIGMPGFQKGLNDDEIQNLANYILVELPHIGRKERPFKSLEDTIQSENFAFILETVVPDLDVPWGMAFLPNGDLLFTERSGLLYRFSDGEKNLISGLPQVIEMGQGGLMDVELHPDFEQNGWIYISFNSPAERKSDGGNTSILRARLVNDELKDIEILFKAQPDLSSGVHFGCRLEFDGKNHLYFTVGERGTTQNAQTLTNHCGKVHRIFDDGRIPDDNPFVGVEGAMPTIYSYGHRNPQGLAIDKKTGIIWEHEHGPKGGDELNVILPGRNYGWPEITFGINYDGTIITNDTAKSGMEQPVYYWIPSIAPCGMDFFEGKVYKGWEGNILIGSLSYEYIERCVLEENKVIHTERLLENIGRVRNIKMGPDGYVYFSIEKPGQILKIIPVEDF